MQPVPCILYLSKARSHNHQYKSDCRLRAIASLGVLNLRPLNCEELPALLPALLPAAWAGAEAAPWTPGEGGHPSEAWLQRLWARLQVHIPSSQYGRNTSCS